MAQRAVGVYPGENDEILVNFEPGQKGVPLQSLLPESGRGKNFDAFDVKGYFGLAQMILVTPEDLATFTRNLNLKGGKSNQPTKGELPPIHPQGLSLCTPNGDLDPDRTAEVFEIVVAYWENPKTMGIHPGYVATALRKGLSAKDIVKFIQHHTRPDPKSGEPVLVFPKATPEEQLVAALLPDDLHMAELTKPKLEKLAAWLSSVPLGEERFNDPRRKVTDIAFLGLADFSGEVDRAATDAARDYIWAHFDQPPNFKALWRHIQASLEQYPADDPKDDYSAYNARVAELYDQKASNTAIAAEVTRLAKSGVAVPTDHLCYGAWLQWQLGRAGRFKPELFDIFNRQKANWLAADAANELLGEVFPDPDAAPMPQGRKIGRNDPCPCGSGKKFKKCCGR